MVLSNLRTGRVKMSRGKRREGDRQRERRGERRGTSSAGENKEREKKFLPLK